jgi:hypothetical protein
MNTGPATPKPITGGCQRGAVRFRLQGKLIEPALCHCRMCQKATGGLFMAMVGTLNADLAMTRGEASWFHSSDVYRRGFCRSCGTPLFLQKIGGQGTGVSIGGLDEPASVRPVACYGVQSRMPWLVEVAMLTGTTTGEEYDSTPRLMSDIDASNHQHPDHDTDNWTPHHG